MKDTVMNLFKKKHSEPAKVSAGEHARSKSVGSAASIHSDTVWKAAPSWWVVLLAYILAGIFWYVVHQFFLWFPPYLKEVFLNLKGLPMDWADKGLLWGERGLVWIAIAAAVYHNLWQIGTRYRLSSHDIIVENWFPVRRVVSVPYGSVRRVGFQQSPLGFLFQYGQVEIETGSALGPLVLPNCPNPTVFVAHLQPKVEAVLQPGLASHNRRNTDPHAQ